MNNFIQQQLSGSLINPKKYLPIFYFDSKETNFPIQSNFYIQDMYDCKYQNNENKNSPTIVPNFINYTTRIKQNKSIRSTLNNEYIIYYYYFCFYENKSNCCFQFNDSDIYIKCIVVETKNDELNRILIPDKDTYYWLNNTDTKLISVRDRCLLYNSYKTHNVYPIKDRIWRFFGLNNDNCDGYIVKMFSLSKCNDETLNTKYYKPFSNLLTEDLSRYPEISINKCKYRNLFTL